MKILWYISSLCARKTLHKNADPVATADATEDDDADAYNTDDPTDFDAYYNVDACIDTYQTIGDYTPGGNSSNHIVSGKGIMREKRL